jgi:hypothetical protein
MEKEQLITELTQLLNIKKVVLGRAIEKGTINRVNAGFHYRLVRSALAIAKDETPELPPSLVVLGFRKYLSEYREKGFPTMQPLFEAVIEKIKSKHSFYKIIESCE